MPLTHLHSVLDVTATLGALFNDADKRLYLVGGIVRDQWLDLPADASSDIDLTTDARPGDIKSIVADFADVIWTQGEKFGTIGLQASGRAFEITTHRAESYTSESRKPVVVFGDEIDVDLSRRDFTINAMAIELPAGELVDPFGGASDLAARVLRTPLSAELSFGDDPLRMLRAARFAARFALSIDPAIDLAATALHERVRIVAIERIGDEVSRLLALDTCGDGLRFLARTGVLSEVLAYGAPELIAETTLALDDGIAWVEALCAADVALRTWQLRLAGLLAGVFGSVENVQRACRRLRLSRDDERTVVQAVRGMRSLPTVALGDAASDGAIRRWVASITDPESALALARAAITGEPATWSRQVEAFEAHYRSLAATEDLTDQRPVMQGAKVMRLLDIGAGPTVGQALDVLQEYRFDHGPVSLEVETEVLKSWWTNAQS